MCFSTTIKPHISNEYRRGAETNCDQYSAIDRGDLRQRVRRACRGLSRSPGIYSYIIMRTAGFEYINERDAARCERCRLEISGWTSDMKPFTIHKQQKPNCPFVTSMLPSQKMIIPSTSNNEEPPSKRLKTDNTATNLVLNILIEVDSLKQVRKQTFSHWPHRSSPSSSQMIETGFFSCNVGDRVICIYCNIICQQWTPHSDDPCEVHKTLSPKCPYVIAMLTRAHTSSISITNEASTYVDPYRCHAIVYTAACNTNYIEIAKRYASFATWPNENLPSVDDLVRAGFFYTGAKNIVTCFYCNGSLQNWGPKDNPTIEHARWFPHCAYTKQLCGAELYRKIQESKKAQQERARNNDSSNQLNIGAGNLSDIRSLIRDESTLSRLVAARLDLPISQSLLDKNFKLSIIKRCWEDQLRLKHDDFATDSDLHMVCSILQKQIEHIDGKKENITVPSVAMKRIREREQTESLSRSRRNVEVGTREQTTTGSTSINPWRNTDVEMATTNSSEVSVQNHTDNVSNLDHCRLCLLEEWHLALLPCAHVRRKTLRHKHSFQS